MIIYSENEFIEKPLVSVIICTYNQEQYINQCIDSILQQKTDFQFEIIIGEDCGKDNTKKICKEYQKKYPERIKLLLNETNSGVLKNWFDCILKSKGKYIMTCGGDDFWHHDGKIQLQVEYMENNNNCGIMYSDYDLYNSITNTIHHSYLKSNSVLTPEGRIQKFIFEGKAHMLAATLCFRKDLIIKYIDISRFVELRFPIEDWPTLVVLSYYTDVKFLDFSTVTYRKGHDSISNPASVEVAKNRMTREKRMYEYICELFPNEFSYNEIEYDIYVNNVLLTIAYNAKDSGNGYIYAKEMFRSGNRSLRTLMSLNKFGFSIWLLIRLIFRKN